MNETIRNSRIVGIDLGTTNTVTHIYGEHGKAKGIPNLEGELKTPSIVYVGPGLKEVLVGAAAWNMQLADPARTIRECKRDVGTDKVYFSEGGQDITPEWCQAEILKYQRQSAMQYFGDDRAASQGVITVPADFGEQRRQSVKRSAALAGIEVIQLINEPTAAGVAFGVNEKQGDRLFMVMDFGGGTFDATLIAMEGNEANVLASNGDKHLGGKEVDEILMDLVVGSYENDYGVDFTPDAYPAEYLGVLENVIRQKHMLRSRTEVTIASRVDGMQVEIGLTREKFADLLQPLMIRIREIAARTIDDAKADLKDVKHVLMVGGSSRLRPFEKLVDGLFGPNARLGGEISPDLAVSEGAAVHAAKKVSTSGKIMVDETLQAIPAPAIKHSDVMPHGLGVSTQDRASDATYCSTILQKNTPIPCSMTKQYTSVDPDQTVFKITVVQGEDKQPIDDCLIVADRELTLPPRKPSDKSIEVSMNYDESGMVQVVVKDLVSGTTEDITVDFYAKV